METGDWGRDLFVRLDPGEEIHQSIQDIFENSIHSSGAITSGIGRVRDIDVGYLASNGIYQRKVVAGPVELLSVQGNIALLDDKQFTHIHVVFSDDDHEVHGGHLFSATVEVTAEIHIRSLPTSDILDITMKRCHIVGSDFKPLSFERCD